MGTLKNYLALASLLALLPACSIRDGSSGGGTGYSAGASAESDGYLAVTDGEAVDTDSAEMSAPQTGDSAAMPATDVAAATGAAESAEVVAAADAAAAAIAAETVAEATVADDTAALPQTPQSEMPADVVPATGSQASSDVVSAPVVPAAEAPVVAEPSVPVAAPQAASEAGSVVAAKSSIGKCGGVYEWKGTPLANGDERSGVMIINQDAEGNFTGQLGAIDLYTQEMEPMYRISGQCLYLEQYPGFSTLIVNIENRKSFQAQVTHTAYPMIIGYMRNFYNTGHFQGPRRN